MEGKDFGFTKAQQLRLGSVGAVGVADQDLLRGFFFAN